MTVEINGITFFQTNLDYQEKHTRKVIQVTPAVRELFRQHQVLTHLKSGRVRFPLETTIEVSHNVAIEPFATFPVGNRLYPMGAFSYSRSELPINTIVGRYSSIATGVSRMGANHPMDRFSTSIVTYESDSAAINAYRNQQTSEFTEIAESQHLDQPVIIGNDVWIGQDVTFSSGGLAINDGAVVAANSVVTKDVPPYAVVAGNPAHIVKYRFDFATIQQLLALRWWQYDFGQFSTVRADDDIGDFIDKVLALQSAGQLRVFEPTPLTLTDFLR
ncbi:CatB-related O-acetyltransferase [Levilactobacillus andaensis]|uniref:CatB-related O-acetyltransferase n=1 Tax=Levilactobacillus andaensis TaxID=2799570 RepID=UPI0019455102|nr:CatB-related O-acetyltransferase [Levilactobacillus andaensis]